VVPSGSIRFPGLRASIRGSVQSIAVFPALVRFTVKTTQSFADPTIRTSTLL